MEATGAFRQEVEVGLMAFVDYLVHLGILIGIYGILALSLNLSLGLTGLMNLGHIAFFGIGAYASAILSEQGLPLWFCVLSAGLIASIFGAILSFPSRRLEGDYLALCTLGFSFIVGSVARNWTSLTRGALGIPGIERLAGSSVETLAMVAILCLITYLILRSIKKSRFGLRLQAIRDDALAAKVCGIDTFRLTMASLAISAFFAGIAGSLYAHYISFIDPSIFGAGDLVLVFSMVIVGGIASLEGSVLGCAILLLLPEPLRFIGFPSSLIGPAREMLFALLLILMLIYRPNGILGKVRLR